MQAPNVSPVFIRYADIPSEAVLGEEICRAAEREVGVNGIFALQKAGGLFRLYPHSEAARSRLVLHGFTVRSTRIFPTPTSPKRTFSHNGIVVQSTRLVVSNLPISVSDTDILEEIKAAGYKPLSALSYDCLRDKHKRLTRFCNGNRSIFVIKPVGPQPKTVRVQGKFTGFIFYPEREAVEGTTSLSPSLLQSQGDATGSNTPVTTNTIPEAESPPIPTGVSHTEYNESAAGLPDSQQADTQLTTAETEEGSSDLPTSNQATVREPRFENPESPSDLLLTPADPPTRESSVEGLENPAPPSPVSSRQTHCLSLADRARLAADIPPTDTSNVHTRGRATTKSKSPQSRGSRAESKPGTRGSNPRRASSATIPSYFSEGDKAPFRPLKRPLQTNACSPSKRPS